MKLFALFGKKDAWIAELACGSAKAAAQNLTDGGITPSANFFMHSLINAVDSFGRHVFCHSKTPELRGIGENPDPEIISRFAQYMAWYFHKRFVLENATYLSQAVREAGDSVRIHLADFEAVRNALFAVTDPFVLYAVAVTQEIPAILDQKHNVGEYRFTEERFRFFFKALGLADIGIHEIAGRKYQADEFGLMQDAEIFAMAQAFHAHLAPPTLLTAG